MNVIHRHLRIHSRGQGLYEISKEVAAVVQQSGVRAGLVSVFCQHTSCSLVLMENADPSAQRDLEYWLNKLVPEGDAGFTHTLEGADDMPSHIKMALTRSSESIPLIKGELQMGTWQGLFLWEHRRQAHQRKLTVTIIGS